jgi:hypothetical protein
VNVNVNRPRSYIKYGWDAKSGVWGSGDSRGADPYVRQHGTIPAFDDDIIYVQFPFHSILVGSNSIYIYMALHCFICIYSSPTLTSSPASRPW